MEGGLTVIREAEPTSHGYAPRERPIPLYLNYGLVNLDKPRGPTSHTVTSWVSRILELPGKAGHGGTLESPDRMGKPQGQWRASDIARQCNKDDNAAL